MIENLINMLTSLLLTVCPGCPAQPVDCHCPQLYNGIDFEEFVAAVVTDVEIISLGGPPQRALDVVFIGDGFAADQLHVFEDSVLAAIRAIRAKEPYSDYPCSFNFYRVNVRSDDNGVDRPYSDDCNPSALNFQFGDPPDPSVPDNEECIAHDQLLITYTRELCYYAAEAATDDWDFIVVLVNDEGFGGGAKYDIAASSIGSRKFHQLITHEIAHTIELGYLEDEYDGSGNYTGEEPHRPNVTTQTQFELIKWRDHITVPPSAIPTPYSYIGGMSRAQILQTVGLFEGGDGYNTGIYHAQPRCHMNKLKHGFCRVCRRAMRKKLTWACAGTLIERGLPRQSESFIWVDGLIVRWTLRCPGCSFVLSEPLRTVTVRVQMETSSHATLKVTDEYGVTLDSGTPPGGGRVQSVEFDADPSKRYYLELQPSEPPDRFVVVNTRIWINDREIALP